MIALTEDYKEKLAVGEAYERYIVGRLRALAPSLVIVRIEGRRAQYRYGDTSIGLEIKLDRKFAETCNLYFETAEKTDPANREFVRSGVLRRDATTLYGIGNYREFFVFKKTVASLYALDMSNRGKAIATSYGVLMPRCDALDLAARHYIWPDRLPDGTLSKGDTRIR